MANGARYPYSRQFRHKRNPGIVTERAGTVSRVENRHMMKRAVPQVRAAAARGTDRGRYRYRLVRQGYPNPGGVSERIRIDTPPAGKYPGGVCVRASTQKRRTQNFLPLMRSHKNTL